jgi:hypothetical protein
MVTTSIYCVVSKYLCGSVPLCVSEVRLIEAQLLRPLVAMVMGDITECPLLLWLLVAMTPSNITEFLLLLCL